MPDLLKEASLLLAREAARLPAHPAGAARSVRAVADPPQQVIAGSDAALSEPERETLQRQLTGVIDTLRRLLPQPAAPALQQPLGLLARLPPEVPRRDGPMPARSSGSSRGSTGSVWSFSCAAPVAAGGTGQLALTVANRGASSYPVALYSTALIAGTGFEIPAVHVVAAPRLIELAPHSEAVFQLAIFVPPQAAPGTYAGLIRALGLSDFQAVIALEVS